MDDKAGTGVGALTGVGRDYRFPEVADYVRRAIAHEADTPELADLLLRILARGGRVLAPAGRAKWPAFVLATSQALGGASTAAIGVAAAVEFILAAADVVDDLVDDEWEYEVAPSSRALNATLALTSLAYYCIGSLSLPLGAERTQRMTGLIARGLAAACAGEDLDLRIEAQPVATEEEALEMTARKSGSLVAMACQLGAGVATDDPAVLDLVGAFGRHVGIVAQLLNDIGGVKPGAASSGHDLRRRKKTLPIAYALRCARDEDIAVLLDWSRGATPIGDDELTVLATTIDELGGLHYAWVVADAHRREALARLNQLAELTGRAQVTHLRRLIPELRPRRKVARAIPG